MADTLRWRMAYALDRMRVSAGHWFGRHLPRQLAYWAVMGVWARATTGPYQDRAPDEVTVWDALRMLEGKPGSTGYDNETLNSQVARLAAWIMEYIPGEPSGPQGAVDTAIRLLARAYNPTAPEAVLPPTHPLAREAADAPTP